MCACTVWCTSIRKKWYVPDLALANYTLRLSNLLANQPRLSSALRYVDYKIARIAELVIETIPCVPLSFLVWSCIKTTFVFAFLNKYFFIYL